MKVYITESAFGTFALDQDGNILTFSLFAKNASEAAKKIIQLQEGAVIEELETLIIAFKGQDVTYILEDELLARNLRDKLDVKIEFEKPSGVAKMFRKNLLDYINRTGSEISESEFNEFIWNVNTNLTRMKIKEAGEKRDKMIVQAVFSLDDIDNSLNLFSTRVREWYSLHFPEFDKIVPSHPTFVQIVSELGLRSNFTTEKLENLPKISNEMAEKLVREAGKSMVQKFQSMILES